MLNKLTPHHFPNGFPWTPRGSFPFCEKGGAVNKVEGGLLLGNCLLEEKLCSREIACLKKSDPPPTLFAAMYLPSTVYNYVFPSTENTP